MKIVYAILFFLSLFVLASCNSLDSPTLDTLSENIIRYEDSFTFNSVFPLSIEENCVGYPGTVTVNGSGLAHITEFVSGRNAGNFQLLQRVEGSFFVEADDPATYPITYSGSYEENTNFRLSRKNEHFSDHLLLTAIGTDGSFIKFSFNFHVLIKNGEVQIDSFTVNCIR